MHTRHLTNTSHPHPLKIHTQTHIKGKVVYIGLLGVITWEIVTVARYWTWLWGAAVVGSYLVVFPFVLLYPRAQTLIGVVDPSWCAAGC